MDGPNRFLVNKICNHETQTNRNYIAVSNMQYSKWGMSRLRQLFVFRSASLTVDKNTLQNPRLAIWQKRLCTFLQ